jgi:putative membrane protein
MDDPAEDAPTGRASGAGFDPRVLQANERTLLAWLRTTIALIAFGFVLARSGAWMEAMTGEPAPLAEHLEWLGLVLVGCGGLFSAVAGASYLRVRQAIVKGRPVPVARMLAPALAIALAAIGLTLLVLLLIEAV